MTVVETEADRTGLLPAIAARFARLGRFAVDVVLPPTCLACRVPVGEGGGLCPRYWAGAGFNERPYCERLGTPFPSDYGGPLISPAALAEPPAYARARAVARYGDVVRDLVHLLKYGDRLDLVAALGRWMARAGAELLADADLLVPVPLHWTRLWQRRFNQSSVLAQEISKISGVPAADHLLSRARAAAAIRSRAQGAREKRAGRLRSAEGGARRGQRQEARARRRRADHRRHRRCLHQGAFAGGAARVDVLVLARVVDRA